LPLKTNRTTNFCETKIAMSLPLCIRQSPE
jgi:hypothetical protein